MWSTALPLATMLERVERCGLPLIEGTASVVYDETLLEAPAAEIWDQLREGPALAHFARFDHHGISVVWDQSTYPKHVDHGIGPGRIGVESELRPAAVTALFTETATPAIAPWAARILDTEEA